MNEDRSSNEPTQRSWFERLGQALMGEPQDREQLVELLRDAEQRNLLNPDALAMIEGVLQVSEMQVRDIMIPRSQMAIIEREAQLSELLPVVIEAGHSRYPVIGENKDEVIGMLLAKDLLSFTAGGEADKFNLRDILRPAVFVPESKRLDVLLKEFRSSRNHMAIVVDEYGGVAGLVTIEDVLEQIVGEIEDEYDFDETAAILKLNEHEFTVKALTPIDEFNEYFDTDYSDEEFDTIGGVITNSFGHVPKRNETVVLGELEFRIMRADKRRVHLLKIVRRQEATESGT
ncbi:HlyC/CorC family transporter [Sulfuriflexus sp.]|uniref:HlyC/CorC family transporter n=1 Tax=Sulfuriflexus sp. TaxID=2015443 RepID=UPI0028CC8A6B|nr:transporter associated domain-containing protein [Sulfuriflexus sp.]MDT8405376.1 transporter associated domain-containing protein [Sulfuriflexus sp.]